MKGLTTTDRVLVQVGTSTTFFIQGTVRTTAGAALVEGVLVKADATHGHDGQRGLLRDHGAERGQRNDDRDENRPSLIQPEPPPTSRIQ